MLPIRDPEYMFDQSFNEQLEFNPRLLPNGGSYFPSTPTVFCPDVFHDLFLASNIIGITNATPTSSTRPTLPPLGDSAASVERQEGDGSRSRKRGVRKCRHSKIVTASGPRDRRMRLSTDVARSFFRLQDTLGFDKASKTVQWLLTMSKAAIGELGTLSPAELSACSNQSPKSESSSALVCQDSSTISNSKNKSSSTVTAAAAGQVKKTKARKGAVKPTRKVEYHSAPARESRAKARARARERTREKQRMTSSEFTKDDTSLNNLNPPSMEFANIEEDESRAPNSGWLNVAGDTAYEEVPMIGGGGSVLIPIFENGQHTMAIDDAGGIFEEQWDVDALSLYSTTTSLVASWDSYPNV